MGDEPARGAARRKVHGRRRGKALKPSQRRHLATLLPRLVVPGVAPDGAPERRAVDLAALFPGAREVWLEIGFGGGEHLHGLARAHPDVGLIGCEPFVNGVAMLLGRIAAEDPGTIRIHPGDARDLVDLLPDAGLGRAYLLYPDPWPKARHAKRRFASPANLAALARAMRPGAELRLATDSADYAAHAVAAAAEVPALRPVVAGPPDWARPWAGWSGTRYEAKALRAGRAPHYLVYRRC
jgi:tRNA (guanine-N7-)-methyltransferase